jgi:hypothetical protein
MSLCSLIVCAVQTVGLMLASGHTKGGYEAFTPGVYAVSPQGLAAGVYSNSHGDAAAFIGKQFESPKVMGASAGLLLGGVVGYGKPAPLLIPSVKVGAVRLSYIPKHPSKPTGSDALHISLEFAL